MTSVSRRDIIWVSFPDQNEIPPEEFDNPHPAIVIQNNSDNNSLDSTVVVPLTTNQNGEVRLLTDVRVSAATEDIDEDSTAKLNLLSSVSVPGRIFDEGENEGAWKIGEISPTKMTEIENKLE